MSVPAVTFLLFLVAFVTMLAMQRAYTIDRRGIDADWQEQLDRIVTEAEAQHETARMYRERWLTAQMRLRKFGVNE